MNGIEINGMRLFLGHLPGRKSLCFYFVDGSVIHAVGYVSKQLEERACEKWMKMLGDVKEE